MKDLLRIFRIRKSEFFKIIFVTLIIISIIISRAVFTSFEKS